ncbi:hypothetical protein ASG52_25275 [Methylobacterium sp. Leaf456]|uniref:hypothetical protein n=1 Tax=Methylobacterium sp. Leaf456 TaxID=1736382 RepID=UPI0006FC6316|nr:hypothetical protein [Methylobacterium sp. Leaf456]KQT55038.1 hypothetical protein ASG52_25275 [Methylobacterium sp. Leaf456]
MAEIIRFPTSRRIPATAIPRERFEELAQLSLDLVDQIVALLAECEPPPDRLEAEDVAEVAFLETFGGCKPDITR